MKEKEREREDMGLILREIKEFRMEERKDREELERGVKGYKERNKESKREIGLKNE